MPEQDEVIADGALPRSIAKIPTMACVTAWVFALVAISFTNLSAFLLRQEDRWLLLASAIAVIACSQAVRRRAYPLAAPAWAIIATATGLVALCYAGHYGLLAGHALSRDEQMALFDAGIFARGQLFAPLPGHWVQDGTALNTRFMYPVLHPSAWVSSYLPMNAALHAGVGLIADPALTGPLMVGLGAVALCGCVRTLWPGDREAMLVALLLYALSGQIVMTGMTSFAMNAHLALNLVWLWLFLRRRWTTDLAALAIGFVATGLHQPLFHPLFAAPILFLLLSERAWARAALFAAGYAAICAFWLLWPGWMVALISGPQSFVAPSGVDYLTRLIDTVKTGDSLRIANMLANMLRFVAWQHVMLIPLALAAWPAIRRGGLPAALAWGVALPVAIMLIILPWQGNGFGYRYLHGVIGNLILLAVLGWQELGERRTEWRSLVLRLSLAMVLVILPLQAWMAHRSYWAFARISRTIARSPSDFVVIGRNDASFSHNLVINRADLSNRPLRLIAEDIGPDMVARLCRRGATVALADDALLAPIPAYFGEVQRTVARERNAVLGPRMRAAGCRVTILR